MARDLQHFELPEWRQSLPRRSYGGGRAPERPSRREHGEGLVDQADQVADSLQHRHQNTPQGLNPQLVFKLQLHQNGNLDEEKLNQMGLQVLARGPERAVVVFPDEGTLEELRRRLREYAGLVPGGHDYGYLASIEAITELGPEDRVGPRLRDTPLYEGETTALDIELWHTGNRTECQERIQELRAYLENHNLRLTDWYIGDNLLLVRAQLSAAVLEELLTADYVKEIDRRSEPAFEMTEILRQELANFTVSGSEETLEGLIGVVVVDSGVMQGHPLLSPAFGDAQVFPDHLHGRVREGAEDGDERCGGHGTAVAGIAVYSDVGECIERRAFSPSAQLFSARVVDDNNQYDEEELIEHQLEEAIEYFLKNYPQVRVVNISLGDQRLVYSDSSYQFRFAAAVDEIAYRYRDRDVVFVVSAGNYWPEHLTDEEALEQYPAYLVNSADSRIIDPATSAIAVTVGGLSYGEGTTLATSGNNSTNRLVGGERGWPSPFTRTGWGVDGSVKPDLVDFAGDMRFERGRVLELPAYAGLPTTAKAFAPPEGRLFRTVSGTSYAAPRVANLAARLFRDMPDATSNLIRALIADSARVPENRPPYFSGRDVWEEDILRVYGYGQPNFVRARWSSESEVLLLAEGSLEVGSFRVYTIPSLPDEFLSASGCGYISATLAFDPPTRHTRMDSYLGVNMEFSLFRNVPPENVSDAVRILSDEEKVNLEDAPSLGNLEANGPVTVSLKPGVNKRKKGTLQRGLARISRSNWNYDGAPLVLIVTCRRMWAPVEVSHQRFAVVVSLWHDNPEVNIHAHVQQQARVSQRVRVRA